MEQGQQRDPREGKDLFVPDRYPAGMETRELRYFVAVAEEMHFGRAAQRLGMAQPPLSRAIQRLERRLGVDLLVRTSRRVGLTAAGEVLLAEARAALERVAAAERRTRRAGQRGLAVVLKPSGDGGLLADVLSAYEADPDAVPAEMVMCGMGEQAGLLREGRGDVALLHVTQRTDLAGLDSHELLVERQVAVLPTGHPLAARAALRLADLAGEPVVRSGDELPVRDGAQLVQLVALGRVVAVLPESVRPRLGRDLAAVPVLDAPTVALHVAWPAASTSRAVAAFVRAAAAVAERHAAPNASATARLSS
jgi:DNA-binding transcriptional LysR family regulator